MEYSNMIKTIFELVIFVISLIQQTARINFHRIVSLLRIFSSNWVEIPLSDKRRKNIQVDDPWKGDVSLSKPKFITLPVFSEENSRNTRSSDENSNLIGYNITNKPVDELNLNNEGLWINPKERNFQFLIDNSRSTYANNLGQKNYLIKKKSQLSNTAVKLAEYDSINRNYLSQGDFYFTFTHPSVPNILNKSYLNSSSQSIFKPSRNFKRKLTSFKPTELSTIYENLAY